MFKIGDKVRYVSTKKALEKDEIYVVTGVDEDRITVEVCQGVTVTVGSDTLELT